MAIVSRRPRRVEQDTEDAESVMTAAAGGLGQRFMRKVAGIAHVGTDSSDSDTESDTVDVEKQEKKCRKRSKSTSSPEKDHKSKSPKHVKEKDFAASGKADVRTESNQPTDAEKVKKEVEAKKSRGIAQATKLNQLEQTVPADAQMPPESVEKVREAQERLTANRSSSKVWRVRLSGS